MLSSVNSTNSSHQQSLPCSVPDNAQSKTKDKGTDISVNSDDLGVDLFSKLTAANKRIIQENIKILQQEQTTVELQSEDSDPSRQQLPNELVSSIINNLSTDQNTLYECTLVSQSFYSIANPLLWKAPVLKEKSVSERFLGCSLNTSLRRLSTTIGYLSVLHLVGPHWTDDTLILLMPHLTLLEHMTIGKLTSISDKSFQHLPRYCQRLASLDLLHMESMSQLSFTDIDKCCQLVAFEWFNSYDAPSTNQLQRIMRCPVQRLHISSCKPLRQKTLNVIKPSWWLESLSLLHRNIHLNFHCHINYLLQHGLPKLTNLSLGPCEDLEETTMMTFLRSQPCLQELELYVATGLTDASLDAMAVSLQQLTRLTLTYNGNITTDAVRRLVRQCNGLVYANFEDCRGFIPSLLYSNSGERRVLEQEELDNIRQDITE